VKTIKQWEDELAQQDDNLRMSFDWRAFMQFLFDSPGVAEKIGRAWLLFFDICSNLDRIGMYAATYQSLARRYQVAPVTVKKWRQYLCQHSIIESFTRGHWIVFRLTGPYLSFLRPANTKEIPGTNELLLRAVLNAIKGEERHSKVS